VKHIQTIAAVLASLALMAAVYYGECRRRAYYQHGRTNDESSRRAGVVLDGQGQDGNTGQTDSEPNAPALPATDSHGQTGASRLPGDVSRLPAQTSALVRGGTVRVGAADRRLLDAIRQVESGGNDRAIGDCGKAHGPLQIHLGAWLDGGGKAVDYPRLAYSVEASERIAINYWRRYGAVTDEARARTWNGGPNGMNKAATLPYWRKVQAAKGEKRCQ